jgi:GT2 family glycosyltransferase
MTASTAPSTAPERMPSVLVVLVVRDAADRLRSCLHALGAQDYERLGILAVDDGSIDGSHELLVQALGEERIIQNEGPVGFAASCDRAVTHPVAAGSDFLLLLHDDAILDPEGVSRLVEATQLAGVGDVGIVGAKVVDLDHPRRLRDVGRSADRFGHPYSPLQADEIDQGQFDRVLDVMAVDACAMLVSRDLWQRLGLYDERLGDDGGLDLCWRARVGGWSVLMTPRARVRHAAIGERGEEAEARSRRYEEDRAALASVLKNYSFGSLLWVLPVGILLTGLRLLFLLLARRFDEAYELIASIGWNLVHLPGTLSRRRRVQKRRAVPDRALRRFMESAGLRLPRWFQTAEQLLEEQRELAEEEAERSAGRRFRDRTTSLIMTHPVLVTSFLALIVGVVATRHLLGPELLTGGALPAFPATPGGFFAELVSAYRTTGLGGAHAASPALAAMGGLSFATFGSTAIAQKVMIAGGPALAAILMYRACVRLSSRPGPSVVAAAAYGLSAITLWAFSDGRLSLLVALVVLPPLVERVEIGFRPEPPPEGTRRYVAGLAVTLSVGIAFEPGVALVVLLLLGVQLVFGRAKARGARDLLMAALVAAVLLFPFVPTLLASAGAALGSQVGTLDPWRTLRLALGDAPGSGPIAYFLPLAAVLGLSIMSWEFRGVSIRATAIAVLGTSLAWISAAGYLPVSISNPPVYAAVAGVAEAMLVAFGVASVAGRIGRESFGSRQIATGLLALVLASGLLFQSITAVAAQWGVGPSRVPAAWAVVDSNAKGSFRVLWIGADDGAVFPAPGGSPERVVEAGDSTLRYTLTDRGGVQAIDMGRTLVGPGADALDRAILDVLSGHTRHGGALLAPFGIRFVVGTEDSIPPPVREVLEAQTDLDVLPATGLFILRDAVGLPPASVVSLDEAERAIVSSGDASTLQRFQPPRPVPLETVEGGWEGTSEDGNTILLSTEADDAWQLDASDASPQVAFGWATSFEDAPPSVRVSYGAQLPRTVQLWLLAAVWAVALWVTRRPVTR